MKNIAVILSGSGRFDGSEIHEATLTLLALSKNEVNYMCFAPNKNQYHVINHLTEEVSNETRNVLVESARIARGNIKDIKELNAKDFDALVLPGGFGAAKNLSSFAYEGENFRVDTDVERVVKDFHNSKKPIAALCIAPVIISKVLGAEVTIGNDKETATIIEHVGGKHIIKDYHEIAIDTKNLIVTNPCYMIADDIYKVWLGAEASIEALLGLIK
ncbi:MAG: isoprenoid biosynthesis glyoxalase ElbB [Bacteroidales bacterium]|nr:isoprenoid biosynthesis glyoxalase ElbB [Bacteroidales bacterium]MDY0313920.1 isoprenoid biosynthesis glyoxalase ElbB [Bacteroidales bacterium]